MPKLILSFYLIFCFSACQFTSDQDQNSNNQKINISFEIPFPEIMDNPVLVGRLFLMLSTNEEVEPRFEIRDDRNTQQIFGMDVENWKKGETLSFDINSLGYPLERFNVLPEGSYYVQLLFHKYETFNKSDGYVVNMPMDRGEGQQWNIAPGNLYSTPQELLINTTGKKAFRINLDQKIDTIPVPDDSKYIKHIKIKSELLSEFWGRDMHLGAHILLPEGFEEHPNVKYPLAIMHGHFPRDFSGFRTQPPDPNLEPEYSERFQLEGYNRIVQQEAYDFYKLWTGPEFPRVIAIVIQHANPFYDDSYAVNSENLGPYGDAITYELIPYIEEKFRGIGQGWARFTYGGSTGGWEALAVQVKYPEEYNGCYAACPDPIDFRAFCLVNLYEDENAYYKEGPFKKVLIPGHRNYLGEVDAYLLDMNRRELILGTKSRSGQQWDIWEAVFSPVGKDGYPQRIWDKYSGKIHHEVAEFWKENYDLTYILKRDWAKNGKNWEGKIHLYCGDMDNYYLNNAVYLAEEILEETTSPYYNGEIDYGDRAEHCWNGDHTQPNAISRLRYHRMFIPKWAEEVKKRAPKGADLSSWRY